MNVFHIRVCRCRGYSEQNFDEKIGGHRCNFLFTIFLTFFVGHSIAVPLPRVFTTVVAPIGRPSDCPSNRRKKFRLFPTRGAGCSVGIRNTPNRNIFLYGPKIPKKLGQMGLGTLRLVTKFHVPEFDPSPYNRGVEISVKLTFSNFEPSLGGGVSHGRPMFRQNPRALVGAFHRCKFGCDPARTLPAADGQSC